MKRIITSAFVIMLTIGAAQAQTTSTDKSQGHRKEQKMAFDELNLSADQKARLQTIREDFKKQASDLKNNTQLSAEEKQSHRKELHQQFRTQSEAVLTPAQKEQWSKMKEERRSAYKGKKGDFKKDGQARNNRGRDFQQELDLSAEQQQKVASLRSEFRPKLESLRNDNSLSAEQKRAKMQELMKQQQDQMKSILTPEQIQKIEAMRQQHSKKK